jgi:hypothetical protein
MVGVEYWGVMLAGLVQGEAPQLCVLIYKPVK